MELPIQAEISGSLFEIKYADTNQTGIYLLKRTSPEGIRTTTPLAVNVDPAEGDLNRNSPAEIASLLQGVNYSFHAAADFQVESDESRFEPRDWLLVALAIILLAEQLLAYKLSYHWK